MRMSRNVGFGVSVAVFIIVARYAAAEDWPAFRGPDGQGVGQAKKLPVEWGDSKNLVWKTTLPGAGSSSPVCLNGKLYLTCYSGYGQGQSGSNIDDLRRHVLCVDGKTGKILWNTVVPPKPPEREKVRDHGYAASTPVTDGEHLYVFFGKCGVFKFDLNGKKIWQADVGSGTHAWGSGSSPILHDGLVIVNASVESGKLIALSKKTGKEVWSAPGMKMCWGTPQIVDIDGKKELVISVKNQILGFDPASGKRLWNARGVPDYICPSVVSQDGVVYAIGGRKSKAFAVKAGGRGDVTKTHTVWAADVGANVPSPVIHDGRLYWVSDRNRHAYCLDLKDGSIVYDERFPADPWASMLCADGKLFVVSRNKGAFVLPAKPEFKILGKNSFSDKTLFQASPIIADGDLILRSDAALYRVGGN